MASNIETIITQMPLVMYDAINSTVVVCDPSDFLKTTDEKAMYEFARLKSYTPENVIALENIIKKLGMKDLANAIGNNLKSQGLPDIARFYAMVDIMSEEFCKSIGDPEQKLRIEVLAKTCKLANPHVFDHVQEYSQKNFGSNVKQIILTQDDPIMKKVYEKTLDGYGLDIVLSNDPMFGKLKKDNPALYQALADSYNRQTSTIGFYDDSQANIDAARKSGIITQLATGAINNDPQRIEQEAEELINDLYEAQSKHM